jgi:hypothetical protein
VPQRLAGAVTGPVVGAARGRATTATGLPRAAAIAATVTAHARPTRMISALAGLHGFSSQRRRVTLLRLDADLLRRIGKQHSATLNEVILSVVGRSLGPAGGGHLGDPRWLQGLHLRPADVLGGVRPCGWRPRRGDRPLSAAGPRPGMRSTTRS